MPNITVRNIPDQIMDKIKTLSAIEKRSINNELLLLMEKGIEKELIELDAAGKKISPATQIQIWEELSGCWVDSKTTQEIITDILSCRTAGRTVNL